jgi:hypothetical protein
LQYATKKGVKETGKMESENNGMSETGKRNRE